MTQSLIGHKSPDIQTGIVFAPYIHMESTAIIESSLLKKAEIKVKAINRERQIDSILEDKDFIPMDIKETAEYKEFENTYMKPLTGIKSRYAIASIGNEYKKTN